MEKQLPYLLSTAKPENISYSAATVPAGEALTVKGINMDVVSAVVFSGNVEVTVSDATATAISLTVPYKLPKLGPYF